MSGRVVAGAVVCGAISCSVVAQGTLIDVPDRRDHVFDGTRGILYISTTNGTVERYELASGQLLSPFSASGTSFNGLDVAEDGSRILVADAMQGATDGVFHIFDAATGARSSASYIRAFGEGEAWDAAITSEGYAVVTTEYNGSGWTPMRRLDLDTREFSDQIRRVRQRTHLFRGADRTTLLYAESNISSGPIGLYDAPSREFIAQRDTSTFHSSTMGAVNRDGSLMALELRGGISLRDRDLNTVEELDGLQGGLIFSPVADILFAADDVMNEIVALDTTTFAVLDRYPIGEDITRSAPLGDGVMSISPDGNNLFISTPDGVRYFEVIGGNPCFADFDGDGELTLFDFLAYQNAFDAGDLAADCDEDGSLTLFDFLCFQNEFDAGCD